MGNSYKVDFILNYDSKKERWKAEFVLSRRHTVVKYFKTCREAQEYYKNNYEGKVVGSRTIYD